ncbi:hypothetical protein F3Y22_tig00017792pilonHSYRG00039 [Hibiscus syriacus]|uniref:Uncharacterized protein n=1 Tax=Hibiscus syriacus TaxID=106335 RepID=A0A6A3BWJ1_HIBSY|nr:hypothetical protein F3Y22_tig00017792pilonHSYRG00039 [Hibiscus syriacus]
MPYKSPQSLGNMQNINLASYSEKFAAANQGKRKVSANDVRETKKVENEKGAASSSALDDAPTPLTGSNHPPCNNDESDSKSLEQDHSRTGIGPGNASSKNEKSSKAPETSQNRELAALLDFTSDK